LCLKPADLVRLFRVINIFPMRFCVGHFLTLFPNVTRI
jgi:hypothetical protein